MKHLYFDLAGDTVVTSFQLEGIVELTKGNQGSTITAKRKIIEIKFFSNLSDVVYLGNYHNLYHKFGVEKA